MKELITSGANVDVQTNTGATALYFASINGHTEVVNELKMKGASMLKPEHILSEDNSLLNQFLNF